VLLRPDYAKQALDKIKRTLDSGEMQISRHRAINNMLCIALITKLDDDIVMVHRVTVRQKDNESELKRMLLASTGYLYSKYYNKETG